MQQSLDLDKVQAQFNQLRRSEYFPAIMGAAAGGLAGAIIALAIGSRKQVTVERVTEASAADQGVILGFSAKDLLQLATVVASLARQLREWRDQA